MINVDNNGNPIIHVFCEHLEQKQDCNICNPVVVHDVEASIYVNQFTLQSRFDIYQDAIFFDKDTLNEI
jgi:hypothetical protein